MQQLCWMDRLVDEPARGKAMEKILRAQRLPDRRGCEPLSSNETMHRCFSA